MIILDWDKNSEEVLAQGHYNTKRSVNAEQTHLCRYWQEQGVEYNEAYKIWILLESPQVVASLDDTERKEYFDKFWNVALQQGPNTKFVYGLTDTEFSYIDSLEVDLEYKNFLRLLAEYTRSYGIDGVFYCSKTIWSGLSTAFRRRITMDRTKLTSTWNRKYGLFDFCPMIQDQKMKRRIELFYLDKEGIPVPSNASKPFKELQAICPNCGANFDLTAKTQTELCPKCQKQQRYYLQHPNISPCKNVRNPDIKIVRINSLLGFENISDDYAIDEEGHVWNLPRNREIGNSPNSSGYLRVQIKGQRISVHRLVALAFVSGYQEGLVVDHINGDKTDNRAVNLQWLTSGENARKSLLKRVALTTKEGEIIKIYQSAQEAADDTGELVNTIRRACTRGSHHSRGRWWSYYDA